MLNAVPLLLALTAAASTVSASGAVRRPVLLARQIVPLACLDEGLTTCGNGCIKADEICCPDGSGGCPVNAYCDMASDGTYGCCPKGQTCKNLKVTASLVISNSGPLPTSTIPEPTFTFTSMPRPPASIPTLPLFSLSTTYSPPASEQTTTSVPPVQQPPVPQPTSTSTNDNGDETATTTTSSEASTVPTDNAAVAVVGGHAAANIVAGLLAGAAAFLL